ncbi:hypothetical protein Y032_0955g3200 [Ancylostoma ceylanicum]|uniref:C-type lectin domain-containing protein n=1 Tax=Ancylostoma ceylanicum TaxID=53326 RepID=A0A016W8L7_9BILA|nr:hypothetical protein Y032_0955g3200 [Ancylostoma ceylanicum]
MHIQLRQLAWILCLQLVPLALSESDTFDRFCKMPGLNGKGKLEGKKECTVEYPKGTTDKKKAEAFCRKRLPYRATMFKEGKPTTCVYRKEYTCKANEEELFDKCLLVKEQPGPFSLTACPDGYSLHVLKDRVNDYKWVTVIFRKHRTLWVGNTGSNARILKPQPQPKGRKPGKISGTTKGYGPIFIVVSQWNRDGTKRGSAYYGDPKDQRPYLCSRPAKAL